MIKAKLNWHKLLNIVTIIFLLALPYYIFGGKLYLGGDDTRLFYSYPFDFLKNATYFAWYNVSSVGINVSNQYLIPFLTIWTGLNRIINNVIVSSYLALSFPLIFAFVYFKKFVKELFNFENTFNLELYIGSLFYILSPILIINQLFIFLTSIWLLGFVPAVGYYYLKYLKTSKFMYAYICMLLCFIFAFAILSIPWLLGFVLPILTGLVVLAILSKKQDIVIFFKKSVVFFSFLIFSQSFWLFGFLAPYLIKDKNSFAAKFLSQSFLDTFSQTVLATATGNIIYPLLGLFHRKIAFDFEWKLKNDFINFYDKTFFLNFIFITVVGIGILNYKKYLNSKDRKIYLFVLTSVLASLFLFTVNIGFLKDVFLFMGHLPGFVMFRNFYDKFAPGFIFIYSILITISLAIVKKKYPNKHQVINFLMLFVILINFFPVKSTVNSPLWTTNNVYKTLNIPEEYIDFMKTIKDEISPSNTILSVPIGGSVYTVIKDGNSDNVYAGTSPVKIFSGVNDISGPLSFNFTNEGSKFENDIITRKYSELNDILFIHNINYVLVTKNIPKQVLKSYVFNQETIEKQDNNFLSAITDKKILASKNGNYILYSTKRKNTFLQSNNLSFQKINSVKYKLYIRNIKHTQQLKFNDSYHVDWKLFLTKNPSNNFCRKIITSEIRNTLECKNDFTFFNFDELPLLWEIPIFENSQRTTNGTSITWTIDPSFIKKNYGREYYKLNNDGSIDIQLVLYFKQQLYLYYGFVGSLLVLLAGGVFILKNKKDG